MTEQTKTKALLEGITDQLAAIEHERWSHWQRYMHAQCQKSSDGSLTIPAELVARWEKQATTIFADLTEREKESDREQVERYLPLIAKTLSSE